MPVISIILVTYNREHFLPIMLESIKQQTFQDYELILVNNGSTDSTPEICAQYAANDLRVKLIMLDKNMGASYGRNIGIDAVTGEYIAFLDDDDRCDYEMFEFLFKLAKEEQADITMCGSYNDFGDRLEPYYISDEKFVFNRLDGIRELLKRELYNVAPPTKLFKHEVWGDLKFPECKLIDDIHLIYKAFERAKSVAGWNKPLYYFRKHNSNLSGFIHNAGTLTPELLDEYLDMYQTRAEYLLERAPELSNEINDSILSFMKNMCKNITENQIHDCDTHLEKMKKYLAERGVLV